MRIIGILMLSAALGGAPVLATASDVEVAQGRIRSIDGAELNVAGKLYTVPPGAVDLGAFSVGDSVVVRYEADAGGRTVVRMGRAGVPKLIPPTVPE